MKIFNKAGFTALQARVCEQHQFHRPEHKIQGQIEKAENQTNGKKREMIIHKFKSHKNDAYLDINSPLNYICIELWPPYQGIQGNANVNICENNEQVNLCIYTY